ncbi:glycosyltransferase involved in cell wall biosynthesis [Caulobacter sp. BK020]|nr:glycosyltransferase involved in cell wall biosynthesis [Caulobacter sp. BK020]
MNPATTAAGPIVVAGFHGAVLGLGEAARALASALASTGTAVQAWDVSERLGHMRRLDLGDATAPDAGSGVIIAHMNPPELIQLIASDPTPFEGKRVIGYWAWELPTVPGLWKPAFRYVDEIWVPSRFTADAVRSAAPRGLAVRVAPHPVPVSPATPDRARFGLDPNHVIVLSAFDLRSTLARKNPLAALEAFRRAVARTHRPATLVFKTMGGAEAPAALASLLAAIGDAHDVVLIDQALSAADRDRLLASCDILLSLHRSEGFGLLLAEAMAAGKAVIATGWSGNLDYMSDRTAVLVPYTLISVDDPQGIYRGGHWAQADIETAGRALAELIDDDARREAIGRRAQEAVGAQLATPVIADLMRRFLDGDTAPPLSR